MPAAAAVLRTLLVAALAAGLVACDDEPTDATPDGAVRRFVAAMARGETQRAAIREAFELLDGAARRELGRRAERASTLSGRRFHPWDLIPQGRFRLRFRPRREDAYRATVDGDRATVTVFGEAPDQRADVPLVREDGRWRIALPIPGARRDAAPREAGDDGTAPAPADEG